LNFQQLNYFLVLATEKNFSAAANLLFITQSTLSQSIANMEKSLGTSLFIRSKGKVELTYAGEQYIHTAHQILNLQSGFSEKHGVDSDLLDRGRLIVGVSFMRSPIYLPLIIPAFAEKYPNIKIHCAEMVSEKLDVATAKGYVDLSIHILSNTHFDVVDEPIMEESFCIVAFPPNHPFKDRIPPGPQDFTNLPTLELTDILNERFIYLKTGHRVRTFCDEIFMKTGQYPKNSFTTDNSLTALNLVLAGFGVTIVSQGIAQFARLLAEPLYFSIKNYDWRRWFVASYNKKRGLSNVAREFINLTKQLIGEQKQSLVP
jgi:LysR family hydrogen peroxide-inducible transcriptional activator